MRCVNRLLCLCLVTVLSVTTAAAQSGPGSNGAGEQVVASRPISGTVEAATIWYHFAAIPVTGTLKCVIVTDKKSGKKTRQTVANITGKATDVIQGGTLAAIAKSQQKMDFTFTAKAAKAGCEIDTNTNNNTNTGKLFWRTGMPWNGLLTIAHSGNSANTSTNGEKSQIFSDASECNTFNYLSSLFSFRGEKTTVHANLILG